MYNWEKIHWNISCIGILYRVCYSDFQCPVNMGVFVNQFSFSLFQMDSKIAKNLVSTSIRHRTDTLALDQCLIDVDWGYQRSGLWFIQWNGIFKIPDRLSVNDNGIWNCLTSHWYGTWHYLMLKVASIKAFQNKSVQYFTTLVATRLFLSGWCNATHCLMVSRHALSCVANKRLLPFASNCEQEWAYIRLHKFQDK